MKKILTCLICFAIIVCVLAITPSVEAANGYPDIPNFRIDSEGMMTWDAVSGATYYDVFYKIDESNIAAGTSNTNYDLHSAFINDGARTGDYTVRIVAKGSGTLAETQFTYHYVNDNQCPDLSNLHWDGYVLRWDNMGSEYGYTVYLYEVSGGSDNFVTWFSIGQNYYDMSSRAIDKSKQYYLKVYARRSGWANSKWETSEKKNGRFTLNKISLSLDGDYVTFGDYIDDEGNEPAKYYLGYSIPGLATGKTVEDKTINVKDILDERNADEAYWRFYGAAYNEEGIRTSDYSDYVYYRYGDPDYRMVFYDANGGTGTINPVEVTKGERYVVTSQEFKAPEGYVFSHWYCEKFGNVYASDSFIVNDWTGDITLVAQWKLKPVEITITGDIATWEPIPGAVYYNVGIGNTTSGMHGGAITSCSQDLLLMCGIYDLEYESFGPNTFTLEVTALDENGNEVSATGYASYNYDPDASDRAVVVFDNNGENAPEIGQQAAVAVDKGTLFRNTYNDPDDFTLHNPEGKVFYEWYFDSVMGSRVHPNYPVRSNLKVYAGWKDAIDVIDVTYPVLVPGMTADQYNPDDLSDRISLPDGESRYSVDDAVWVTEDHGTYEGVIESGETYWLYISFLADDTGSAFAVDHCTGAREFTVIANGEEEDVTGDWDVDYIQIYIPVTVYKSGWNYVNGEWYFYKSDGTLLTNGWAKDSTGWMWMGPDGKITKNKWIKDNGEWYYLKSNGYMAANEWTKDSTGWMYMDNSGKITKNKWIKDNGEWYYVKSNGYMAANEWTKDSTGWMYMSSNGKITKNKWIKSNGEWYYLKSSGYMAANEWIKDSTGWMYMDSSGKITKSKWIKYNGDWYYLKADGYMATGTLNIGGKEYTFASSGKLVA